jgi:peptidyl-prolyl cis-trans isomerase C
MDAQLVRSMLFAHGISKPAAVLALALLFAAPAAAQDAGEDKVIAIVNGHEIRTSEVSMAADDIVGQLPDLPPKLRFPFVVQYLIERHLIAQHAVKNGIADTEEYKRRLALYQAKALRDAYFFQTVKPAITDEEIKAMYDQEASKVKQTERVRARHILVGTEQEAKDILAKLEKGEKFEVLAKAFSQDGSKEFGGDLGYFTAPEMVAEFSKAAFALEKGQISQPVKTDFGWHIIKLEDRKAGGAQPFDQVKGAIRNLLLRKKVQEIAGQLTKDAKIEILDDDLKAYMEKQKLEREKGAKPAAEGGDAPAEGDLGGGKSDLQIEQQQ